MDQPGCLLDPHLQLMTIVHITQPLPITVVELAEVRVVWDYRISSTEIESVVDTPIHLQAW